MNDLVSQCCQAKYRNRKHDGGSTPECTQCGKPCNVMAPDANPAEPINVKEMIADEQ